MTDEQKADEQQVDEAPTSTYVVQIQAGDDPAWRDMVTVTVPQRRQRKTVLHEALEQIGTATLPTKGRARVLDVSSAEAHAFGYEQPPAQLVIG